MAAASMNDEIEHVRRKRILRRATG